jgi:hypothetical protein
MRAVIAASAELQEREALKSIGLSVAMTSALIERGVAKSVAQLAAELGVLAFKQGYAAWVDAGADTGFAPHAVAALAALRAASAAL